MKVNQQALFDVLGDLAETLEWAIQKIEFLEKTVQTFQENQGQPVTPLADAERLSSIRALRQRVDAIRQELRRNPK